MCRRDMPARSASKGFINWWNWIYKRVSISSKTTVQQDCATITHVTGADSSSDWAGRSAEPRAQSGARARTLHSASDRPKLSRNCPLWEVGAGTIARQQRDNVRAGRAEAQRKGHSRRRCRLARRVDKGGAEQGANNYPRPGRPEHRLQVVVRAELDEKLDCADRKIAWRTGSKESGVVVERSRIHHGAAEVKAKRNDVIAVGQPIEQPLRVASCRLHRFGHVLASRIPRRIHVHRKGEEARAFQYLNGLEVRCYVLYELHTVTRAQTWRIVSAEEPSGPGDAANDGNQLQGMRLLRGITATDARASARIWPEGKVGSSVRASSPGGERTTSTNLRRSEPVARIAAVLDVAERRRV